VTYRHGPTPIRGELWACEHPERPADGYTRFYEGCPACLIALRATIENQGDLLMTYVDTDESDISCTPIAATDAITLWENW